MDGLNLNSIINHCERKTSGDGLSANIAKESLIRIDILLYLC